MDPATLNRVLRRIPDQLRDDTVRRIKHAEAMGWRLLDLPRCDWSGARFHPRDLVGYPPGSDVMGPVPDPPEPQAAGADAKDW